MSEPVGAILGNVESVRPGKRELWPIMLALFLMYFPTYLNLLENVWVKPEGSHGPIVFVMVLWLYYKKIHEKSPKDSKPNYVVGAIFLLLGFLLYLPGRMFGIYVFDVGSQIPILFGIYLIVFGNQTLKKMFWPTLFFAFVVPLPSFLIDPLTSELKETVSYLVDAILYSFGYPISRNGVVLQLGGYQLLIADACSGLNSMFALSGLGIIYIAMSSINNRIHVLLLLLSILPVAFAANIIRVLVLAMVTYHFGDGAGMVVHDAAAIIEFFSALFFIFLVDRFLAKMLP
ncbi:MAG: exosortase [Gammaproteobacteria bacterium]|nr:exosortase [Gammaproteobacteria bacterium]